LDDLVVAACAVDTLTAVGLVAQIGGISAFKHPKMKPTSSLSPYRFIRRF